MCCSRSNRETQYDFIEIHTDDNTVNITSDCNGMPQRSANASGLSQKQNKQQYRKSKINVLIAKATDVIMITLPKSDQHNNIKKTPELQESEIFRRETCRFRHPPLQIKAELSRTGVGVRPPTPRVRDSSAPDLFFDREYFLIFFLWSRPKPGQG